MTQEEIVKQIEGVDAIADNMTKREFVQASIAKALWEIALQLAKHQPTQGA